MIIRTNSPAVDVNMLRAFVEWQLLRLLVQHWQTPPLWGRF